MRRIEQTPEQRYERIRETIQDTILRNFPNPGRKGCPGDRVVQEVAGRRELIEDDEWQHITHCSPCYALFLKSKNELRGFRRRRGLVVLATGVAAALVLASTFTVYEFSHRREEASRPGEDTYEVATLDLTDTSPMRSPESSSGNPASRFLPNRKLNLTIHLPFGSEPGKYEVQLRKAGQVLETVGNNAIEQQGRTDVQLKIDLSKYPPGDYAVAIRQALWYWQENPVTLR